MFSLAIRRQSASLICPVIRCIHNITFCLKILPRFIFMSATSQSSAPHCLRRMSPNCWCDSPPVRSGTMLGTVTIVSIFPFCCKTVSAAWRASQYKYLPLNQFRLLRSSRKSCLVALNISDQCFLPGSGIGSAMAKLCPYFMIRCV